MEFFIFVGNFVLHPASIYQINIIEHIGDSCEAIVFVIRRPSYKNSIVASLDPPPPPFHQVKNIIHSNIFHSKLYRLGANRK